jgi:hypothetical protein
VCVDASLALDEGGCGEGEGTSSRPASAGPDSAAATSVTTFKSLDVLGSDESRKKGQRGTQNENGTTVRTYSFNNYSVV